LVVRHIHATRRARDGRFTLHFLAGLSLRCLPRLLHRTFFCALHLLRFLLHLLPSLVNIDYDVRRVIDSFMADARTSGVRIEHRHWPAA
jgi:hypothetical protein